MILCGSLILTLTHGNIFEFVVAFGDSRLQSDFLGDRDWIDAREQHEEDRNGAVGFSVNFVDAKWMLLVKNAPIFSLTKKDRPLAILSGLMALRRSNRRKDSNSLNDLGR